MKTNVSKTLLSSAVTAILLSSSAATATTRLPVSTDVGPGPGITDSKPAIRAAGKVRYPSRAADSEQEGWAILEMDVDVDGSISNLEIVDASNMKLFGRHAYRLVEGSIAEPAIVDGKPVAVSDYRMRVRYRLVDPADS